MIFYFFFKKDEAFNTIDTSLVNPIFPVQFLNMGKVKT